MAAAEVFMATAGFLALWDAGDQQDAAALRLQQELYWASARINR
ncbi:MAG TPA: hypothetical protein VGM65_02400 [Candidatus Udaeobacter sp.]|jgi:hypothetical protein